MGKRSDFVRAERDFYPTPLKAVLPLLEFLPEGGVTFVEPCAGPNVLVDHLESFGSKCLRRSDLPEQDALTIDEDYCAGADFIITNPPWSRDLLHPMIDHFVSLRPTWLLIDADWAFTKQSAPYMNRCRSIVPIGRVKWIPDSPHTGKDNCCWYYFDDYVEDYTRFYYYREHNKG